MSRFVLAFSCFFRLLFGKKLSPDAVRFLPEDALPKQLPEQVPPKVTERVVERVVEVEKPAREDKARLSAGQHQRDGALALLALLQREGRLVDFLRESTDAAAPSR